MGACCGNNRNISSKSIYCIDSEGRSIIEYNILQDKFEQHLLDFQLPALAKYCEILPDRIFITGGFKRLKNKYGEPVSDVYLFEKYSGLTSKPNLPQARTGHCIVAIYGSVYVISGVISHINPTTECNKFDYYNNHWKKISPISKPRILAAACGIGHYIYVTGGNPGNSLKNYRDIEKYNVICDKWEGINIMIPMDIWRHSCLPHKGGIIVFGGNGNRCQNLDCFKIDFGRNVVVQQTWLAQGGEFQGCNIGCDDKVFAFETLSSRAVWIYSQGKWTMRQKTSAFTEQQTL